MGKDRILLPKSRKKSGNSLLKEIEIGLQEVKKMQDGKLPVKTLGQLIEELKEIDNK